MYDILNYFTKCNGDGLVMCHFMSWDLMVGSWGLVVMSWGIVVMSWGIVVMSWGLIW